MSKNNSGGARKKEFKAPTVSDREERTEHEKRQRTASTTGLHGALGEIPASPPKYITLDELMKATDGFSNMILAHEIAVNEDFKFEKLQLPENSLQKQVEDVVQKAFWDALESELAEDPPNYKLAIGLINTIKTNLLKLLLPQHTKIHQQISEVLDIDLIKQQAEAGTLDFQLYAQYVISVMGKLCAPVRDEKIASLTKITDVVEVFKGILETLHLMKLDMANFTIKHMRPQIVANSIEYEKKKFADILSVDRFGLVKTKEWLERHMAAGKEISDIKKKAAAVLNNGYLELLEWNEQAYEFPETMILDKVRILELKPQFETLTLAGAILLLTYAQSGPDLCSIDDFKQKIKNDTLILLNDVEFTPTTDLKPVLLAISQKLRSDLLSAAEQYGITGVHSKVAILEPQICELNDTNHIRNLLKQRIKEFLLGMITSQSVEPMKIPPGLSSLQKEVTQLAGNFLRIISRNRAVYEEYYVDIVEEFSKAGNGSMAGLWLNLVGSLSNRLQGILPAERLV